MKQICAFIVTGICFLLIHANAYSQTLIETVKTTIIEPYPLWVTFNKTTNLIFPYAIKSVDRGSRDVLAQKAKGVENILLVKAGRETFAETNLSVITSDGKLYSFLLRYTSNPSLLNISFIKDNVIQNTASLPESESNEAQINQIAEKVAKENRSLGSPKDKQNEMALHLNGLYIRNNVFYFQLKLHNRSNIPYDIEMLRFLIRDDQKAKRTASQDIELTPLYLYGDTSSVKEGSKHILVVSVPKFTIPNRKRLLIQLMEGNGGRHLELKVRNRTIVKARKIGG